jgi:hypothetical protein
MTDQAVEIGASVQAQENQQQLFEDTFHLYYPQGVITETNEDEVPVEVLEYFVQQKDKVLPQEEYQSGNFANMYQISHSDGSEGYVSKVTKSFSRDGQRIVTEELNLVDVDANSVMTGNAKVSYIPTPNVSFEHGKPIIHHTETEPAFQKKGLAIRRLLVMNAITQSVYGLPLHSDLTHLSPHATSAWEHLVRDGKAEQFEDPI